MLGLIGDNPVRTIYAIHEVSRANFSLLDPGYSCPTHLYNPAANPVAAVTAETMSCKYRNGGFERSFSVSFGFWNKPPSYAICPRSTGAAQMGKLSVRGRVDQGKRGRVS